MQKVTRFEGLVAPLDRANVDTDAIIPKQFLKSIKRSGFGVNLFDGWRYLDEGRPDFDGSGAEATRPLNPDFVLNQPRYRGAGILLARENFGCGSSREHAPWALLDYGFRAVIAPGFADIFRQNCYKNGLLPIVLDHAVVDQLFRDVAAAPGYRLAVDLAGQTVTAPGNQNFDFVIDASNKHALLNGLDEIGTTLQRGGEIEAFESRHRATQPWLFSAR
ncbi:MAG: 3-isopropylmalate dehydratase small subunit [Burkholderiales bacterium]|nr:3-isopropylmalate dehydratase small subunit [Burkholderiales bacterium]MDQ3197368.1 3-isopropylmalate dehydratase small subunit [Pseudomonadota bacterium]